MEGAELAALETRGIVGDLATIPSDNRKGVRHNINPEDADRAHSVAEIIVKKIHDSFFCHLYGSPLFMRVSRAKKSTTIVIPRKLAVVFHS